MGIFDKTYRWRYEIAPIYAQVETYPMTSDSQTFFVLSGLTSDETFTGTRLPQVGELIRLPTFSSAYQVTTVRTLRAGTRELNSKDYPSVVYFDPSKIENEEFWLIEPGKVRLISQWSWSTDYFASNYKAFGYEPSDWKDKKLKFKERDYVLGWERLNGEYVATDGATYSRLDPKHSYLFDWFPEVRAHLDKIDKIYSSRYL